MICILILLSIMIFLPSVLAQANGCTLNDAKAKVLSVNSNVVCQSQYSWMDNHLQQSPCLVLAYLLARCNEGSWTIQPLQNNPITSYNTPGQTCTPVDVCECSWSAYNLISACTLCQGSAFAESVHTWDAYKTNCTGYYSTSTYWPTSNFTVPDTTAIPYWAGTDPTTWSNGIFDLTSAQNLAGQGHSDLPDDTSSKKTPVGAIAGGVVGAIALLSAILGIVAWRIIRKRRQAKENWEQPGVNGNNGTLHKHSLSGTTAFSGDMTEMGTTTPLNLSGMANTNTTTAAVAHRNTYVSRRMPSTEFTIASTDVEGGLSPSRAGWHSRTTSAGSESTTSLHHQSQSIDVILSSPRRDVTSPSLLDDDDQGDYITTPPRSRQRFNPPSYADVIAATPPRQGAGGSHSPSPSTSTNTGTPGSDMKKVPEKRRLAATTAADTSVDTAADTAADTTADTTVDASADASAIREKAPRE
ncbi:hypothetical protein GLOTRDRAFT_119936 [Gloeophyllum trabeum ATCC 11539]|uniref:Mid2 domain-containing protein n=1 Tax=Gloeophyllum trabeum (strain ATCC 11539 / FP-39264 / Madison 617) TaxID=670483 RepID=S7RTN2_GLOTA|nr:uncharacterized protein GLOTRDRAFT_119936 [Gloeophyllum trabeum ATCC 11539]EPQ58035.1 hypothetical protein GLOTRDRAFT_119936 [Gloeophyllum trabeum ATCC 11539]